MKYKTITYIFVIFVLSSCIDSLFGNKYITSINKNRVIIERYFSVKGLFEHFPNSFSEKSYRFMLSKVPTNTFDPHSIYSVFTYLFLDMADDNVQSYYPSKYLHKTSYSKMNFILDDSFSYYMYTDTQKIRNVALPGTYPIPYFEDFDFGLGSERFDMRSSGLPIIIDKFNVPDDLEVFVLRSDKGFYWKTKFKQDRPDTLGDWKHGYSSGIAISRKLNIVVYWMKAW